MPKATHATNNKTTVVPTTYPLEIVNGKALIVRDFFPSLSPFNFDLAWASRTVSYRPYFVLAALGKDGIVNQNHACGRSNDANIELWLNQVKNEILGQKFKDCMKIGWNEALSQLTKQPEKGLPMENGVSDPDFTFNGKRPVCQTDARKILFDNDVTALVKEGDLERPFALLFMWGYYLTMEGCYMDWAKDATEKYISDEKYQVSLDISCAGLQSMKVHGWYRMASKIAVNSYHTQLRKSQKRAWGMTFEITVRAKSPAVTKEDSLYEVVDIGEYLPQRVKTDIQRVDGTEFVIKRDTGLAMDNQERLRLKIHGLFKWARAHGFDKTAVLQEAENAGEEDGSGTFDTPVKTATEATGGTENDNVGMGLMVGNEGRAPGYSPTMARAIGECLPKRVAVTKLKSPPSVATRHSPRRPKPSDGIGGGGENNSKEKQSGLAVGKKKETRDNIGLFMKSPSKVKSILFVTPINLHIIYAKLTFLYLISTRAQASEMGI